MCDWIVQLRSHDITYYVDSVNERKMGAVYHHKLHVINSLQSLWGTFVPRLFF